jgi:serine/threonine protein phosphatase PrpC
MCCTEAFRYLETSYKKLGAARPQSSEEGMFPSLSAPANPRRASSCMPWCGLPKRGGVDGENGAAIEGGTTACVAVLQMLPWGSDPRVDVVVANAGDSGALLVFEGAEEGADQNDDADEAMVTLPEADGTTRSKPPPMTKWLTRCHSPEDPLEAKRLTDAGARLGRMRRDGVEVGPMRSYPGGYAVSRAIGDFDAPHVVCTPEVKRVSYFLFSHERLE